MASALSRSSSNIKKTVDEARLVKLENDVDDLKILVEELRQQIKEPEKEKKHTMTDGSRRTAVVAPSLKLDTDERFVSMNVLIKDEEDCSIKGVISSRGKYVCQVAGCIKESKMYCGVCLPDNWSNANELKALVFCPQHRCLHICLKKEVLEKCQECFEFSCTVQTSRVFFYCGTCNTYVQSIPNNDLEGTEEAEEKEDGKGQASAARGGAGRCGTVSSSSAGKAGGKKEGKRLLNEENNVMKESECLGQETGRGKKRIIREAGK